MAEIKQKVNCTYCGERNTVTMTFKDTKYSRSIQVSRCEKCKRQNGVKATLTDPTNAL